MCSDPVCSPRIAGPGGKPAICAGGDYLKGEYMKKLLLFALLSVVAMVAVFGVFTEKVNAQTEYLSAFTGIYNTAAGTKLDACVTCHNAGETTLNPYGLDIQNIMLVNSTIIETSIYIAEGMDSDNDTVENYFEIDLLHFPGDPTDYPACADADSDGVSNFYFCNFTTPDCNDSDPSMYPGNSEICDDAKDNDCDGDIDAADSDCESWVCSENDLDGDGFSSYGNWCGPVDCNDGDITIFPGACDIKRDGIDQDCDGVDRTGGKPCN